MVHESLRVIDAQRAKSNAFPYRELTRISAGGGGHKAIIELSFDLGAVETRFLKILPTDYTGNQAIFQQDRHRILQARGATVPSHYDAIILSDNSSAVLVTNLGENGKTVVSYNDGPKFTDGSLAGYVQSLPGTAKAEIRRQLILNCELAVGRGSMPDDVRTPPYELKRQAFMLVIDPANPMHPEIVIGDLDTVDVVDRSGNPRGDENTLQTSLQEAAAFYAFITGESFQAELGEYSRLNSAFETASQEGIALRSRFTQSTS